MTTEKTFPKSLASEPGIIRGKLSSFQQRVEPGGGRPMIVWDFRLERWSADGKPLDRVPVQMRGFSFDGGIAQGDWIEIKADWRGGCTLHVSDIRNLTTGVVVAGRQQPITTKTEWSKDGQREKRFQADKNIADAEHEKISNVVQQHTVGSAASTNQDSQRNQNDTRSFSETGAVRGQVSGFQQRLESLGNGTSEIVWSFRLLCHDKNGQTLSPVPVEMRARSMSGVIGNGDWLEVSAEYQEGLLTPRTVRNLTTHSDVGIANFVRFKYHILPHLVFIPLLIFAIAVIVIIARSL